MTDCQCLSRSLSHQCPDRTPLTALLVVHGGTAESIFCGHDYNVQPWCSSHQSHMMEMKMVCDTSDTTTFKWLSIQEDFITPSYICAVGRNGSSLYLCPYYCLFGEGQQQLFASLTLRKAEPRGYHGKLINHRLLAVRILFVCVQIHYWTVCL